MPRKIVRKQTARKKNDQGTQPVSSLEEIERLAEHALNSGPATPWTTEDKEAIIRRLRAKYGNRNGSKS
jgi:hypothetical protein